LRALNLEFYGGLPARLARVDARGSGFDKIVLRCAASMYCACINASRKDSLRLVALPDHDLVTRITIAQRITEEDARGDVHEFRFYGGEDFYPEIFLSGKRLRFADHVLKRFDQRVPTHIGEDLTFFLLAFYGCPVISMPIPPGRALIVLRDKDILGFPYEAREDGYFVKTCLTANEINSLEIELPPESLNFHYCKAFTRPKIRNWMPLPWMMNLHESWKAKKLPGIVPRLQKPMSWYRVAALIKDSVKKEGHGEGSRMSFIDHIPGPCVLESRPDQVEPQHDEMAELKRLQPEIDWDEEVKRRKL
jgi:hypothetical protein